MNNNEPKFLITLRCEKGHESKIILEAGYAEAGARLFAALLDGSAFPPVSKEAEAMSPFGRCAYGGQSPKDGCGAKFKCEVTNYEEPQVRTRPDLTKRPS